MFCPARVARLARSLPLIALLAAPASAQTRTLTVQLDTSNPVGEVRVLSGAASPVASCAPGGNTTCTMWINQGASVEIAAGYPGRLTGGTGPAAACSLSTCAFTMTGDASITATNSAGPFATVTTTLAGDGTGTIWSDGAACRSGSCAVKYVVGSTVRLTAAAGTARFTGYSSGTGDASACGASATCAFTVNGDSSVTGTFVALTSFAVTPSSATGTPGGASQTFTATGTYSSGPNSVIGSTAGAWSAAPPLPAARSNLAAAAVGNKVYAVGGIYSYFLAANFLTEFDPSTATWAQKAPMASVRFNFAAAVAGGQLYALGGNYYSGFSTFSTGAVERYDPATNTWTARAPMSSRAGVVAGTINGIIYAAGGTNNSLVPLGTLEAYDPATDTWTAKAGMAPRSGATGGVVNGILYVVGGAGMETVGSSSLTVTADVQAYDPATNSWSYKAPLPIPLSGATAAVADGVLYVIAGTIYNQSVVYAYDPVADAWSAKAPMLTPLASGAAAALNGIVYAIGGVPVDVYSSTTLSPVVQTFVDGLRWSSSAPSVARVDQNGVATPLSPGTATIVANVGGTTCGSSCPVYSVVVPSDMSLDVPTTNTVMSSFTPFKIGGWAINRGATTGTGVDAVHIYAQRAGIDTPFFVGVATYGIARPDIGAIYGSQFAGSGFELVTSAPPNAGTYTIFAYAHNALTGTFDAVRTVTIQVTPATSQPHGAVDAPTAGQTVTSAFEVSGWAVDTGTPVAAPGYDGVEFYVQPQGAPAPGVFVGIGTYGIARPDVGALFGAAYTNSGYHFTITGMSPGSYILNVYAHSLVTGDLPLLTSVPFTVSATALMSIDAPAPEATITASTFAVAGWAIDRTVESTALSGTGVDALHVYAYPNPGSGQPPIFLGVATQGISRSDVAAAYGSRYDPSGYQLLVDRNAAGLAPGVYDIVVHAHSAVSGAFNNLAVVRITLQ